MPYLLILSVGCLKTKLNIAEGNILLHRFQYETKKLITEHMTYDNRAGFSFPWKRKWTLAVSAIGWRFLVLKNSDDFSEFRKKLYSHLLSIASPSSK